MPSGFFDTPSLLSLWASIIPFLALSIIVVVLRFVTRRRLRQPLSLDDWLTIPGVIGVIGLTTAYFYGIKTKSLGYRWTLNLPPPGADLETWVPETAEPTTDRIVRTRRVSYTMICRKAAANVC